MIRFRKFCWKTEFPFTKLRNLQSWNLQLKSPLQTNAARPILYSGLYAYPYHHPCTPCENASDRWQGNFSIPHITHRSAVTFRTFHSAFYLPHAAIPHFTNSLLGTVIPKTSGDAGETCWMLWRRAARCGQTIFDLFRCDSAGHH